MVCRMYHMKSSENMLIHSIRMQVSIRGWMVHRNSCKKLPVVQVSTFYIVFVSVTKPKRRRTVWLSMVERGFQSHSARVPSGEGCDARRTSRSWKG